MGVVIKKKPTPEPGVSPVVPDDLQKVMESIGLVVPKEKVVEKFSPGDRVRYTNPYFTWVTSVSVGDLGSILRVVSPIKEALQFGEKYGLLEVKLDNGNTVFLHNWEVEHV